VTPVPCPPALHGTLLAEGEAELRLAGARFRVHRFRNLRTGDPVLALTLGDLAARAPLLTRVHSSCITSEAFGACDCDCAHQLQAAIDAVAAAGRGALFYLFQEGRGAGFSAKARDRMAVQASGERVTTFEAYARMGLARDQRRYEEVAFLLPLLGIAAPLRLLTHNPEKAKAVAGSGVEVAGVVALAPRVTPWNRHYLSAKSRSGHALDDPGEAPSAMPDPLPEIEPELLGEALRFVRIARYRLPVLLPGRERPLWLRLELAYDLCARVERVILAYRGRESAAPLVAVQRETLLDRFAPGFGGARKPAWREALLAFEREGAGLALFLPPDDEAPPEPAVLDLLCAHAGPGARRAPGVREDALGAGLDAALARVGAARGAA
jgi:3,4-dihydroxy 2-butanone 4-phosphate synthase / GTP cyclohydrolase II